MSGPDSVFYIASSSKGIKKLSAASFSPLQGEKKERAKITIPEETKEVLVGTLLGDAHIVRRSSTSNSRLVFAQSAVVHKEYFNHVLNIFLPFCVDNYTPQSGLNRDKRTNKSYSSISFTTMQLPCFNEYREMFYILNVKKVPENIYELLTPRGLAHWIKDDGSRQGSGLHFSSFPQKWE